MKTLRVSDDAHEKLTALLGELTAQKRAMQTYTDAIESLLSRSVILPADLLSEVERVIREKPELGYTTKGEFIRDAVRHRLDEISEELELIEIPKSKFELLEEAVEEMNMPAWNAREFIYDQIDRLLQEYEEFKERKKEFESEPEV